MSNFPHIDPVPAHNPASISDAALRNAYRSLEGLSVGDGFGQSFFFVTPVTAQSRLEGRFIPPSPWFYTDDTVMACSIFRSLKMFGEIDQDFLAQDFADVYTKEPDRGYGGTARGILRAINSGIAWKTASSDVFDGEGSCGNGGAMRAGPIGAYFADEVPKLILQAQKSAEVTHYHKDGQTGAIAVALATAWMVNNGGASDSRGYEMIEFVLDHLPQTETYWRLKKALSLPLEMNPMSAANYLGNGSQVISSDTVPFCLWCVSKNPSDYVQAMWDAVLVQGDIDTNCAIIGSILAFASPEPIPTEWIESREPLPTFDK